MRLIRFVFCFAFFLKLSTKSHTQDFVQVRLSESKGFKLDHGWRYLMKDDPAFSSPAYDDQDWDQLNPTLDVFDTLPGQVERGIGWMRIKLKMPGDFNERIIALSIKQSVASEIYLNGRLLQQYGTISPEPEKVKAFDTYWQPLPLAISADTVQTLAIRFAMQPGIRYTTLFETSNPLIDIDVYPYQKALGLFSGMVARLQSFEYIMIGTCLMIFILHLSFYFLFPAQKANLFFSLFALTYIIASFFQMVYYLYGNPIGIKYYVGNLTFISFMLSDFLILLSIHYYLEQKPDRYLYALIFVFLFAVFLNAVPYNWGWRVGGILFKVLLQLNIARIAILSAKEHKRDARILVAGAIATIILFFTFILQGTFTRENFVESLPLIRMINYILYALAIPVSVSVFLASDFAFTSRGLKEQLAEVRKLSGKNLAIEKEKQEILSTQNIRLEKEVDQRTAELKKSLEELRLTQSQLIQSEKMASLGELTAGIAHEIQNPLNFINNFSDVNEELTAEMLNALEKADFTEVNRLAKDIASNQQKVTAHGKRADAIVKSMLEHSRGGSGQKTPTDLNLLCEEYLRISYHGIQARDKRFKVKMETDFDPSVGKIDIVPPEIGRVLQNLFNNAFYALGEKMKEENKGAVVPENPRGTNAFEPKIIVSTKRVNEKVEIRVKDNGRGIPDGIKEKIFQPFFTTKPTGQGTGLGLSLSYDIIKAHGGDITVRSLEEMGAEFTILLPY